MNAALRALARMEDALLIGVLLLLMVLAASQIGLRNLGLPTLAWADPVLRSGVMWLALLGAAVATRERRQITVDVLTRALMGWPRRAAGFLTNAFAATVAALLAWQCYRFVRDEYQFGGAWLGDIPSWVPQLPMPLVFGLIALRYALFALNELRATAGS